MEFKVVGSHLECPQEYRNKGGCAELVNKVMRGWDHRPTRTKMKRSRRSQQVEEESQFEGSLS